METTPSQDLVARFEVIAERCLQLSHDLADLDDVLRDGGGTIPAIATTANHSRDLALRFETLAGAIHRLGSRGIGLGG